MDKKAIQRSVPVFLPLQRAQDQVICADSLQFCSSVSSWTAPCAAATNLHRDLPILLIPWFQYQPQWHCKRQDEGGGSWHCFHFLVVQSNFQKPGKLICQPVETSLPAPSLYKVCCGLAGTCWPTVCIWGKNIHPVLVLLLQFSKIYYSCYKVCLSS